MPGLRSLYHHFVYLLKGVQVYGLVGKPGTGKSFRAQLIANKFGIDIIIDDGLLIRQQKILAGKSAKQEKGAYSAIKRALFASPEHVKEVKTALEHEEFKRILILGTSIRMVHRIAKILNLPNPSRIIPIEDVATEEEIERARRSRDQEGKHIIPVPAVEVKARHSHIFFNAIRIFAKRQFGLFKKHQVIEKSVVRPVFKDRGRISISEEALTQMVLHCVAEFSPNLEVRKVSFVRKPSNYDIEVFLKAPYRTQISGNIHNLQQYILQNVERYTGLMLNRVSITVDSID
jgi:uncharacterized alkaline shock family protein YloU/adenylate kinase family enzyme